MKKIKNFVFFRTLKINFCYTYNSKGDFMKSIRYLHISIISFICFFFLTIFIINGNQIFFDFPIYQMLIRFSLTGFFQFITDFGNVHFLLFFTFLAFFFLKDKRDFKFLACMMIFEIISNVLLKNFFSRPRPTILWLIEETGFSFPSGHMMASTMFYGLCIYFLCESNKKKSIKITGSCFFTFLIFIIGMSRIYLGVHYASGFLLSLCMLNFGVFFYKSMSLKKEISL